jgi:thymidylate kinase
MTTVALIGPDGAGKTTIARRLPDLLPFPTSYVYMGVAVESSDRLLPTTRLAHALKRRKREGGSSASPPAVADATGTTGPPGTRAAKVSMPRRGRRRSGPRRILGAILGPPLAGLRLVNRLAEEWYRQAVTWREELRGRVVVFDRHFFIDYHAADIAAPERTVRRRVHGWTLEHLYPRPDLVIFLDAPAEVLFARKGEGTLESLERRRRDYLALAPLVHRFEVVDASRPLDVVTADVIRILTDAVGPRDRRAIR